MAADLPSEDSIPSRRYRVVQKIGTGGMGKVYLAIDASRNRKIALKVFSRRRAHLQPQMLERFSAERRYGRRLNHENVARFYRFGSRRDIFYVAMEFVDGITLENYVKQRRQLNNRQALDFVIQATRAINHLRKHGIVHRGIQPSNFMVTGQEPQQRIKLIDLGFMQPTTAAARLGYMSPEQIRDHTLVNLRSTIYSLGCTWYYMLAGAPPFAEGSVERHPRYIGEINADATEGCWKILSRMLASDPLQRYSRPTGLLRELEKEFAISQLGGCHTGQSQVIAESGMSAGQPVRLRSGRVFRSFEDEKRRATSALYDRKKKKLSLFQAVLAWFTRRPR